MVFQDYALYPQMSVRKNLAFGLRMRKIAQRRDRAARGRGGRGARARRRCSSASRASSRAGSASASRSAARSSATRRSSSWTSRSRTSTRSCARRRAARSSALQQRGRDDDGLRHARPGRGDDDGRPDRGHARRAARAGRHPDEVYERPGEPFVAGFIGSPAMSLAPRRRGRTAGCAARRAPARSTPTPSAARRGDRRRAARAHAPVRTPPGCSARSRAPSTTSRRSAARRSSASTARAASRFVVSVDGPRGEQPGRPGPLRPRARGRAALRARGRRRAGGAHGAPSGQVSQ